MTIEFGNILLEKSLQQLEDAVRLNSPSLISLFAMQAQRIDLELIQLRKTNGITTKKGNENSRSSNRKGLRAGKRSPNTKRKRGASSRKSS